MTHETELPALLDRVDVPAGVAHHGHQGELGARRHARRARLLGGHGQRVLQRGADGRLKMSRTLGHEWGRLRIEHRN